MFVAMMGCLLLEKPMKGQAAAYNNTYYCINKILRLMGDGNYVCEEDKDNKKLTIQLLSDVEISDGCGFDGTDDWSDCQADWIPLNEMEITLDFNGHYMNFTGSYGLEISYGANVIFTNSGGIKTSQDITNLVTVGGQIWKSERALCRQRRILGKQREYLLLSVQMKKNL